MSSAVERRAATRRKKARDDQTWQMLLAGDFSMSCIFVALMSLTAEVAEALSGVRFLERLQQCPTRCYGTLQTPCS